MLERLGLLLIAVAVLAAAWLMLRWFLAWRLMRIAQRPPAPALAATLAGSTPDAGPDAAREAASQEATLLYFTTEECAQCRFQQRPILDRLAAATALPIVTINALESEELARFYGILTVPSTVLLDTQRKPVAINHGLAPFDKLRMQVSALA